MKYGFCDDQAREYAITDPRTPVKWINYVGTLALQPGQQFGRAVFSALFRTSSDFHGRSYVWVEEKVYVSRSIPEKTGF
jgi:hypothetical protein